MAKPLASTTFKSFVNSLMPHLEIYIDLDHILFRLIFKDNACFVNASTLGIHVNESISHNYPWFKSNFNGVGVELLSLV